MTALARSTDPVESHEAAESLPDLRPSQDAVLSVLAELSPQGATDAELVTAYRRAVVRGRVPRQSESGIRTRRKELVAAGRVRPSSIRTRTSSGRWARVWVVAR